MVTAGLGRVVRRPGQVGGVLGKRARIVEVHVAVDLAGRDLVKACHADGAGGLQQRLCPDDVGREEVTRTDDRQAVVRLGGEVDHDIDLVLAQQRLDQLAVADVAVHEGDRFQDVGEVLAAARVGQGVQGDHLVSRVVLTPVADEVRPDEPGGPGHQQRRHCVRVPLERSRGRRPPGGRPGASLSCGGLSPAG